MAQDYAPTASVIVPTYNRCALLRQTLMTLERQTVPRQFYEVVVADDGSSDDTRAVVDEFAGRGPVRYVFQNDEGYRAAAARNAGARIAAADILIFLDAGTLAGPDLIAAHVAALRSADLEHPRNAVIGYTYGYNPWQPAGVLRGLVEQLAPKEIVRRLRLDPGFRDMRHDTMAAVDDDTRRLHVPWMLFWTMNVSLTAPDFWAVGGFDEDFRSWGGEDLELGYRLTTSGVRLVVSRAAWAIEPPHERDLESMSASNARNAGLLWSKHPVPAMEMFWGIHGNGSYEPLEELYGDFLRWRDATSNARVTDEVRAVADGRAPALSGRVLVVGADRDFVPPAKAVDVTALCPDENVGSPNADLVVRHAIGLRTTHPDHCFDVVVLTSRLAGLWPRWGPQLWREANRVGKTVVLTPRLRDAVEPDPGRDVNASHSGG